MSPSFACAVVLTALSIGSAAQTDYPDAPSAVASNVTSNSSAVVAPQESVNVLKDDNAPHPTKADTHKFFDKINLLLTGVGAGALLVDSAITQDVLGRTELIQRNVNGVITPVKVPLYYEVNPLSRPFANAGWPGEIGRVSLMLGVDLGVRYLLHRTNHHKAERFVPFVTIATSTAGAIRGATQ